IRARAGAGLARVGPRARAVVVARRAVRLRGVRAHAGRRVARAGVVTLVLRGAGDGVRARAGAGLAGVRARAGVAVVAGRTVRLRGVGAHAGRRVALPGVVTLVLRGADDGIHARAGARFARVRARACVAVVAGRTVRLRGVGARAGRRVARAGVVALVLGGAGDRLPRRARACLAHVGARARVAVVAGRAVGLGGVGARAGRRVARARVVALVPRDARDGLPRGAVSALAHVADRARVAVVAGRPVEHVRIGADARRRVARTRVVTLVEGAAHDGRSRHAASREAHVAGRARVAVLARGAVGRQRRRAEPRQRIARAGVVALIERGADDRRARR